MGSVEGHFEPAAPKCQALWKINYLRVRRRALLAGSFKIIRGR